jgi:hypothetical protein
LARFPKKKRRRTLARRKRRTWAEHLEAVLREGPDAFRRVHRVQLEGFYVVLELLGPKLQRDKRQGETAIIGHVLKRDLKK